MGAAAGRRVADTAAGVRHRAAVIGQPVSHSLSPVLHLAAYAGLGLSDWAYERRETDFEALPWLLDELAAPRLCQGCLASWPLRWWQGSPGPG